MQPSFVSPPLAGGGRSLRALLGDALRRPGGRRGVSVLSLVLFLAGTVMFAYPVGTDVYSRYQQDELAEAFADPAVAQAYRERKVAVGQGLTTMRIPKLGVDVLVVEGTTPSALRAGAGHYVESPLPGEAGNVAIAGHRTTYGRPLNRMDELVPGDIVELETPFDVFTYRAMEPFDGHPNPWIVAPTQYDVVGPTSEGSYLTLTTCHPKGSARQRLIMRFELIGARPVERQEAA
jgi:sortase A